MAVGLAASYFIRRLWILATLGPLLVAVFLIVVFATAPTVEGARSESTEWHGRYSEWGLVLFFGALNLLAYYIVVVTATLSRRRPAK